MFKNYGTTRAETESARRFFWKPAQAGAAVVGRVDRVEAGKGELPDFAVIPRAILYAPDGSPVGVGEVCISLGGSGMRGKITPYDSGKYVIVEYRGEGRAASAELSAPRLFGVRVLDDAEQVQALRQEMARDAESIANAPIAVPAAPAAQPDDSIPF